VAVERTAGREGGVDREETGREDENEPFDRHLTANIRMDSDSDVAIYHILTGNRIQIKHIQI
jgi:hypothetical protein